MKIKVKVVPNASKISVKKKGDLYRVKVDAPPIRGKANKRLIETLARHFGVPKSRVKILKGVYLRVKEIEIKI